MKQTFIKSAMLLLLILSMATTRAQEIALKTNLLGWASTSANAGIEIGTGKKTTFQLFGTLNPWKFSGDKKMRFWNIMPEMAFWLWKCLLTAAFCWWLEWTRQEQDQMKKTEQNNKITGMFEK